uniref:structural cement protein Gp24 n=1 Tax=Pseudodesulfovibrio pelocollis TaxID=3051432 RepID=UPI003CE5BCDE
MTAYLNRMPAGYPGDVTRKGNSVLEPGSIGALAVKYGSPVKLAAGLVAALAALDTIAVVHGFLVRPYPT